MRSVLVLGLVVWSACAKSGTPDSTRRDANPPASDATPPAVDLGSRDLGPGELDATAPCTDGTTRACRTSCGTTGTERCAGGALGGCEPPTESCDNGTDDDCDGRTDEGTDCSPGATESCTTSCGSTGTRTCGTACGWGSCSPPAEVCGGGDDDCDGSIDETSACVPGTMRACTTSCGSSGSQQCTASCGWPTCAPPSETCNGSDDDCDGSVDEGSRAEVVRFSYAGDLAPAHPGCNATTRIGADCNAAFDRACEARACPNGGYGPVENTGDVGFGVCVVGNHHAVSWSALAAEHAPCNSASVATSPDCRAAIHRWCEGNGQRTGFGPVELSSSQAEIVCTPWADVVGTTYTTLATHHAPCNGTGERSGPNCNAAIHRFCASRGAVSGFGPLENTGDHVVVACLSR